MHLRADMGSAAESPRARADLLHPVPLLAVVLLAANDHLLKGSGLLPSWLTGKLSDVAGLFVFPMLLVAMTRPRLPRAIAAGAAVLLTGAAFSAIKLSPVLNAWVAHAWGTMAMDPTDLLALPALAMSFLWLTRTPQHRRSRADSVKQGFGIVLTAIASLATAPSAPSMLPVHASSEAGCAELRAKSCTMDGDYDARVIVDVQSTSPGTCNVELIAVEETGLPGGTQGVEAVMGVRGASPVTLMANARTSLSFAFTRIYPLGPNQECRVVLRFVALETTNGITKDIASDDVTRCVRRSGYLESEK